MKRRKVPVMFASLFLVGQGVYADRPPDAQRRYNDGLRYAREYINAIEEFDRKPNMDLEAFFKARRLYEQRLAETGDEGLDAVEHVVLNDLKDWNPPPTNFLSVYASFTAKDRGGGGRLRLNKFLQDKRLTQKMKIELVWCIADSGPANWIEEETVLPLLQELLADTGRYKAVASTAHEATGHIRYCDFAAQAVGHWSGPLGASGASDPWQEDAQKDIGVRAAQKWVAARLKRLKAIETLFSLIKEYHVLALDRDQIASLFGLWMSLDNPGTIGSLKKLRQLADLLADEVDRWKRESVAVGAREQVFYEEAARRIADLYARHGRAMADPPRWEGADRGAVYGWVRAAVLELRDHAKTWVERKEFEAFALNLGKTSPGSSE